MLTMLMLTSTLATIQYTAVDVQAASDQDGDGLTYGLEYLMNTQPNDPDSDNDGLRRLGGRRSRPAVLQRHGRRRG